MFIHDMPMINKRKKGNNNNQNRRINAQNKQANRIEQLNEIEKKTEREKTNEKKINDNSERRHNKTIKERPANEKNRFCICL